MKKIISFILCCAVILSLSVAAYAFDAGTATTTSPWYGQCTGNGVRIRQSASTDSNILGQIDSGKPIEIVGVPNSNWYKVRYDLNGSIGYISSQYLTVLKTTYGMVLLISGIDMKAGKGSSTTVAHISYGVYMPYKELSYYNNKDWANCVCGRTSGWLNANDSYNFKYRDLP